MKRKISYWEQGPSPVLTKHLECFWFVSDTENSLAGSPERILPDGCLEWIFHLGLPFQRRSETGEWEKQPRSFVVGELTRFLLVRAIGPAAIMGVRFRPGGAYRFLPLPLNMLTDNNISTGDIWGSEGEVLEAAVVAARDHAGRQRLVERFLVRRLALTTSRPRLESAIGQIIHSRGRARVGEVAGRIGLSQRQLEREFRLGVGLSPKAFARLIRFQNLLRLVGEGTLREWITLALEVGYADQPHMVREFREFAGQTPTERQDTVAGELASCFVSPRRLATLLGIS